MESRFALIEKKIGIDFYDKDLLKLAFTHRSYVNENPGKGLISNERLEFLGDSVIRLALSEHFYRTVEGDEEDLHDRREQFVPTQPLASAAARLGLEKYLLFPSGQSDQLMSPSVLEDTYEALTAAIFIDKGYRAAADFVARTLLKSELLLR